jgi:hypothetical protein
MSEVRVSAYADNPYIAAEFDVAVTVATGAIFRLTNKTNSKGVNDIELRQNGHPIVGATRVGFQFGDTGLMLYWRVGDIEYVAQHQRTLKASKVEGLSHGA